MLIKHTIYRLRKSLREYSGWLLALCVFCIINLFYAHLNNEPKKSFDPLGHAVEGVAYVKLAHTIQNIPRNNVTELFWYGCPHCYHAEPVAASLENFSEIHKYEFKKVHFYSKNKKWQFDFNVYRALYALGVEKDVGNAYMKAVQGIDGPRLDRDNISVFLAKHEITTDAFKTALLSSKSIAIKDYAKQFVSDEIKGTPIFIVSGKYVVKDFEKMNEIVDYLIQKQPD